jgi:RhtB (resistance to homoserine/threonine) family protein
VAGIIHFETFLLTGILLNLTPGNDSIFILTNSIGKGKNAGIISALGIATGSFIHTLLAALGLSLIIAKSLVLFQVIKYAGGAYLIFLGLKMFFDKSLFANTDISIDKSVNYPRIYLEAILTNLLNPKVALFFIAFLPQFIEPTAHNTVVPFLLLGITFITTGTIWCLILAVFASAIVTRIKHHTKVLPFINKFCGLTLIGLGIKVALTDQKT